MPETLCHEDAAQLAGPLENLRPMPQPSGVLMCPPDYFDVLEAQNPFMAGQLGKVDKDKAKSQWHEMKTILEKLGKSVHVMPAAPNLEDMVFCANQALPGLGADGQKIALMGRMKYPSRRRETPFVKSRLDQEGYRTLTLTKDICFEGTGDALWHSGKRLIWGGWGQRTRKEAYAEVAQVMGASVCLLEMPNPRFYHLDTCLAVLSREAALIHPPAFTEQGLKLLSAVFPALIEVDAGEAVGQMACNALAIDERWVIIQRGAVKTVRELKKLGFEIIETETSEFMKSGGSVFCMKLLLF
ncbi:MAG: amidinotransferase [Elusimicrobia bacterium]|nr:amidinotransferase [Elusimicrobiota bacterium]